MTTVIAVTTDWMKTAWQTTRLGRRAGAAFLFLSIACALFLPFLALADPLPAVNLTVVESTRRDLTFAPVSAPAQAGNITRLDINAISITKSWQGYYGNITGSIILADANNNTLYEWSNGTLTGEVYASRNATVSWSTIGCGNATVIAAEEAYLGQAATDADSVSNTFTNTSHPGFWVGFTNVSGCPSTNAFVNSTAQSTDYYQVLLADGNASLVYTTIIDQGATGYDGRGWDFQLLVGENGHFDLNPTDYYFFVEIA